MVSNTALAAIAFFALAIVVGATLWTMHERSLTGFATSDSGYVNLSIGQSLNIQVDPTNSTINFGTCTPRASAYWCATNDSAICDGTVANNCSGDSANPAFIRLDNVGNVDANITVNSSCTASQLIGGTSPSLQFITTQCNGTAVSSWTDLGTTVNACNNLSYQGGMMRMYANVTIPNDATGGCSNQATILFTATVSP